MIVYWLEAGYLLVVRDEYSSRGFVKPMQDETCLNGAFNSVMDGIVTDRSIRLSADMQNLPERLYERVHSWLSMFGQMPRQL